MNDFVSWESLATFAGCTAAVAIFTQFVKNLPPLKNVATQIVSYGIALVLLYAATYFTGGLNPSIAALIPFNAVIVSLGANGAFSAVTRVITPTTDKIIPTDAGNDEKPAETVAEDVAKEADAEQDKNSTTETK